MKIKTMSLLVLFLSLGAFVPPSDAQEISTPSEKNEVRPDRRMTLRFRGIELKDLLAYVSKATGLKFRLPPELADRRVTFFSRNVTAEEVMELLNKAKGLEFRREPDGAYSVAPGGRVPFPPLTGKDLEDPLLQRVVEKVRMKEAPLSTFLEVISSQARVNFVITENAADIKITAELRQTTMADILQFLRSRGFEYSRVAATNTFVLRAAGPDAEAFSAAEAAFNEELYEKAALAYQEIADRNRSSDMADYALLMSAVSYDWQAAKENSIQALNAEEEALRRLIKDYPGSLRLGDAYLYLGQIYSGYGGFRTGAIDCAKALKYYGLAVQNTYRDWVKAQALARTAQCHELAGDSVRAAAVRKEIQAKYPDTPTARELRGPAERDPLLEAGAALERAGDYELALQAYKRLIAKKGAHGDAVREAEARVKACQAALDGK